MIRSTGMDEAHLRDAGALGHMLDTDQKAVRIKLLGEHLVGSSSPSYCHMGRARCCNGWMRLPIKTEISCPPVKLSFNTSILSINGATADDSSADKEWGL